MKVYRTSGYKLPNEGEYVATVTDVKNLGKKLNKFGKETEQLQFTFELENGLTQLAWANAVLAPSSKFYEISSALLARNPPDEIDTDLLIGRRARIYIEHYTAQDGRIKSKVTMYRVAPKPGSTEPKEEPKEETTQVDKEQVDEEGVPF
jgi:hypothetical protein